jgi:hypothetical protein
MEERNFKNFYKYYSEDVKSMLYTFLISVFSVFFCFLFNEVIPILAQVLLMIAALIGFFFVLQLPVAIIQTISYFLNRDSKYTFYTRMGFDEPRQQLLNLGFVETVSEWNPRNSPEFVFKGIYENMPLEIKGSNNIFVTIKIPMLLEIDDSYYEFWRNFAKKYPPQEINFNQTILGKQIIIDKQNSAKVFWETISKLQNILEEQEYRGQKLINYVDKEGY